MKGDKFLDDRTLAIKRLIKEYEKHGSLVIGFDFDGTINDFHKEGYEFPKMRQLLRDLKGIGCKLVCWTAYKDHQEVMDLLNKWEIPFDSINGDGVDLGYSSRKPFFSALLDDRAGLVEVYHQLCKLVDHVKSKEEPFIRTITAPSEPDIIGFPYRIYLGGTMNKNGKDWQSKFENKLKKRLSKEPSLIGAKVVLFNPIGDVDLDTQITWEIERMEESDIVVFNIEPENQSDVSLVGLSQAIRNGNVVIRCSKEFNQRKYLESFADRYYMGFGDFKINETIDEILEHIIEIMNYSYKEIL